MNLKTFLTLGALLFGVTDSSVLVTTAKTGVTAASLSATPHTLPIDMAEMDVTNTLSLTVTVKPGTSRAVRIWCDESDDKSKWAVVTVCDPGLAVSSCAPDKREFLLADYDSVGGRKILSTRWSIKKRWARCHVDDPDDGSGTATVEGTRSWQESAEGVASVGDNKTIAMVSYDNDTLAASTEVILVSNRSENAGSALKVIGRSSQPTYLDVWLGGGAWPVDVAYNTTGEALPVELFVRWRSQLGEWRYDGYLFPGIGSAFYRIPLPPLPAAGDELEVVVYNPRSTSTADVSLLGHLKTGSVEPKFVPQQISSVLVPDGNAVVSRAYGTYCFRRPLEASQIRYYMLSTDSTAGEQFSVGFYRPSFSQDGAFWGGLGSSTNTLNRFTITGDLVCALAIFTGSFDDASTASLRFSVALSSYAP
jgi:hypothetical protein